MCGGKTAKVDAKGIGDGVMEEREERYWPLSAVGEYVDAPNAKRLQNEGLVFAINYLLLHPVGLALGVAVPRGEWDQEAVVAERVVAVTLDQASDEWRFEDGTLERGLAKLRAAGHDDIAALVVAKSEAS